MLKDLVEYLVGRGEALHAAQNAVTVMDIPGRRKEKLLIQKGEATQIEVEPPSYSRGADTLASLVELVRMEGSGESSIWISWPRVIVEYGDSHREDRATFIIPISAQFKRVEGLVSRPELGQREAVRLFFHDLRGYCASGLADKFRQVDWQNRADTRATVRREQESLSREVLQQVKAGADAIPETIEIDIPLSTAAVCDDRQSITLSIDVDHANQKFIIAPLPDEIERAVDRQAKVVADWIATKAGLDEVPPIYFGTP